MHYRIRCIILKLQEKKSKEMEDIQNRTKRIKMHAYIFYKYNCNVRHDFISTTMLQWLDIFMQLSLLPILVGKVKSCPGFF